MNQREFLTKVVEELERLGIPYMIVGSYASMAFGEPRFTQDIDVVALLKPQDVGPLCAAFPTPDYYVSPHAILDAIRTDFQFNILHPASGNRVDVMMARKDELGTAQMTRRKKIALLPGLEGFTASPADIILGKMRYYREGGSEKHLRDIMGILKVSEQLVDRTYLESWVKRLAYEDIWKAVQDRLREVD